MQIIQSNKNKKLLIGIWSIALIFAVVLSVMVIKHNKTTQISKNLTQYDLKEMTYSLMETIEEKTNNSEIIQTTSNGQIVKQYTLTRNTKELSRNDEPIFKLTKKDAETKEPIPNVKFSIYNVDGEEVPARDIKGEIVGTLEIINGKEYYVVKTNENGEISLDLPKGLYKAVEVAAPDKYDLSRDNTYYFGIDSSKESTTEWKMEWFHQGYFHAVIATADGGVIAGRSGEIIKYNSEGEMEWKQNVDCSYIVSIAETTDGGIIIGGKKQSRTTNNIMGTVIKYNADGEMEWNKEIGGNGPGGIVPARDMTEMKENCIASVVAASDGGVIVGGCFFGRMEIGNEVLMTARPESSDGIVIKYNSAGEIEWFKQIRHTEYIYAVAETNDHGVVAGGYLGQIVKYNSIGEEEWRENIGKTVYSIVVTDDGNIRYSVVERQRMPMAVANDGEVIVRDLEPAIIAKGEEFINLIPILPGWTNGGVIELYAISGTQDGGIVITGGPINTAGMAIRCRKNKTS